MWEIGHRLRAMRERSGLTQGQVATYEGCDPNYISKLELGKNQPNVWQMLANLARRYHTTTDYLLGLSDDWRPASYAASLVANAPAGLPVTAVRVVTAPTATAAPVAAVAPVAAPAVEPTATSSGWAKEVKGYIFQSDCPCDQGNVRNCGDFGDGYAAQACYLRCMDLAYGDVHGLDRDDDGSACEWSW